MCFNEKINCIWIRKREDRVSDPVRHSGWVRYGGAGRHTRYDQSKAEEKCLSGRHHSSWYSTHTHTTGCSSSGQLPRWTATPGIKSPL